MKRIQWIAASVLFCGTLARAGEVSYTGTFTQDDQMFQVNFSLATAVNITMRTFSFAGGTDAAGQLIPAGGFAPVVSVFDSLGNLVLFDDGGVAPNACGPRQIDADTGFCLDGVIQGIFPAGTYTAILTEWDNTPNGPTLADGFVEQGQGNFTGGPFLLNAGPGFQRTGNWELDVPGTAAPEPAYAAGLGLLLCLLAIARSRRATLFLLPLLARGATLHVSDDTYLSQAFPQQNFGGSPTLNIGAGNAALIRVDLSSLPSTITGNNIQKATLTVFVNKVFTAGAMDLKPLTNTWSESSALYGQVGSGAVLSTMPVTVSGSYVTFDVTSLVAGWVGNPSTNFGVEIVPSTTQPATVVALDSKESTATGHAAYVDVVLASAGPAGPTGATGPQGPAGAQGLNWRGNWDSTVIYSQNDAVFYSGSAWISLSGPPHPPNIIPLNLNVTPGTSGDWWSLLSQGTTGAAGQKCVGNGVVIGFDTSGNILCTTSTLIVCNPQTFSFTFASETSTVNGSIVQVWPNSYDPTFGSGSCTGQILSPTGPGGHRSTCPIDGQPNGGGTCFGTTLTWSGFSSCTMTQTVDCSALGATAGLQGTVPVCSTDAGTSHATDKVAISCQ